MIERKHFIDDDETPFSTGECWDMSFVGVQISIRQPKFSASKDGSMWSLWLDPELARKVAAELIAIADSVDRQQAEIGDSEK